MIFSCAVWVCKRFLKFRISCCHPVYLGIEIVSVCYETVLFVSVVSIKARNNETNRNLLFLVSRNKPKQMRNRSCFGLFRFEPKFIFVCFEDTLLSFDEKICQSAALFWFVLRDVGILQRFYSRVVHQRTIVDSPAFLEPGFGEKIAVCAHTSRLPKK
jgi:hypothetical protein